MCDAPQRDPHRLHRRRQHRVHARPAGRPPHLRRPRRAARRAPRHRPRAARDRRGDVALDGAGARRPAVALDAPRPPRGARRRGLRVQHGPGRRACGDAARLRDSRPARAAPDDRRHAGDRRRVPALRTIPVMLGIGRDMAELCPDAWLLNYTNPMAMLCQAYAHGSPHTKIVGLCHSIQHTTRQLAEYVDVPFEEVTFLGAGVNHQSFILRFERDGEDLYPALDAAIAGSEELQRHVRVELYKRFRYFPTESSEHSAEYLPWLMRSDEALERFRIPVDEYVRRSEENLELYDDLKARLRDGRGFEIERSVEYAPLIVHAIVTGQPEVIYGNVVNDGLIDNLPAGACVEVPCVVDRTGVQPTHVGPLPVQCAALNRTFLNVVELTVAAALEGSREHVYHAAMLDPNASGSLGLDEIRAVCDELIEAHGDALPALA